MKLYTGVVENRQDPLKLGRCQVRVVHEHTHDKAVLPTEDLPWAVPVQPTTSAAMSGIGSTPLGPVEGTWVVVAFNDYPNNQQPLILGSIGGIPQDFGDIDEQDDTAILKDDAGVAKNGIVTDGNGDVQSSNEEAPAEAITAKPAANFTEVTTDADELIIRYEEFKSTAILDNNRNVYKVGYGTSKIKSSAVKSTNTTTKEKAEKLITAQLNDDELPSIKGGIRTLVTQSMIDAIACLAYDIGWDKVKNSILLKELNAGRYLDAAARFVDYNTAQIPASIDPLDIPTFPDFPTKYGDLGDGSFARVLNNDNVTLSNADGVFEWTSSGTEYSYTTPSIQGYKQKKIIGGNTEVQYIQNGLKLDLVYDKNNRLLTTEGNYSMMDQTTVGSLTRRRDAEKNLFLKDGIPNVTGDVTKLENDEDPIDETNTGLKDRGASALYGFRDPKGKYPLYTYEPDTNRLARHEEIGKTIVYKKEAARDKNVSIANTTETWDQSPIPYNAEYPFNHVHFSESGHAMEFDDTPRSERINIYHRSGTFTEIDSNGTQVNRIVGDGYEILERNGYVHIMGSENVTIEGAKKVKVENTYDLEVSGATNIVIHNDANISVAGQCDLSVGESLNAIAETINLEATSEFNLKSNGGFFISSTDNMDINVGETLNVDYNTGNFGDGASNADSSGLTLPTGFETPTMPNINELTVLTRGATTSQTYETPEEGDPTDFRSLQESTGNIPADEYDKGSVSEKVKVPASTITPVSVSCDLINNMDKFSPSLVLSKHFTLGAFTKGGSRPIVDQFDLTKQEIVCNLKNLAVNCLEPIIEKFPNMIITSGFRRPGDVRGSAARSQHYYGMAADIVLPGFTREEVYKKVQEIAKLIPYDQLLLEYSGTKTVWIHVSLNLNGNRGALFTMRDHKRISDYGEYALVV